MMNAAVFITLAGLLGQAFAFPQALDKRQDPRAWTAPGSGDVRSPCPGLNTLANHGYINSNGRGITKQSMQQGFLDAFGLAFEITQPGGQNALNLQCDGCQTFDLDTLDRPHAIEHDGSMTRNDAQESWSQNADNHSFNQTLWTQTLGIYGCNTHVNAQLANHVRNTRFDQAQAEDFPGWFVRADGGSIAEHSFILATMFDPTIGINNPSARLDWIDAWFTQERLPTALGWRRPDTVSNDVFNSIANAVGSAPSTSVAAKSVCSPTTTSSSSSATSTSSSAVTSGPSVSSTSSASTLITSSRVSSVSASTVSPPFPIGNTTVPAGTASGTGIGSTAISTSSVVSTVIPGGPAPTVSISVTSKPGDKPSGTQAPTSTQTVPASVSSSAQAKATELAGPAPAQPDAYHVVLTNAQWISFTQVVYKYVEVIRTICSGLVGSHEVGSIALPGSSGTGGSGAPWMGSMPAAPASAANGNPASPSAPTTPASSSIPGYGSCSCQC